MLDINLVAAGLCSIASALCFKKAHDVSKNRKDEWIPMSAELTETQYRVFVAVIGDFEARKSVRNLRFVVGDGTSGLTTVLLDVNKDHRADYQYLKIAHLLKKVG